MGEITERVQTSVREVFVVLHLRKLPLFKNPVIFSHAAITYNGIFTELTGQNMV